MNENNRVILCGDGWGAISAFKSLKKSKFELLVISDDDFFVEKESDIILNTLENELIVFAGYKPIVSLSVLQKNTCINIHYSLLPQYRGLHSTVWAILNNEEQLGLSVHLMDEFIDNGAVLHQFSIDNDFVKNATDYMNEFNNYIESHLGQVISDYLDDKIKPLIQNKTNASWVGKRNKEDCKVDFNKSISYQKAFFRALVKPYPLPFITYKNNDYTITSVDFHLSSVQTHIGRVLNIDNEGLWVKISDGYLIIKELVDDSGEIFNLNNFRIGQYLNK